MKIVVDSNRCQGHNLCQSYADDLISIDEFGFATVEYDGDLTDDQLVRARLAESNCPEQAIVLREG